MAIKLIILGLRRSGTTIFWETFRQDPRLVCYDEPFNELIRGMPERGGLKHPEEFIRLFHQDPAEFWKRYTSIPRSQELKAGLSDEHRRYLDYLGATGEHVAIDVTRCHYRIAALRECAPNATLVHLYRTAPSHATSHMLPSASGPRGGLRKGLRKRAFWTRADGFDNWGIESLVGSSTESLFAARLREAGMDPREVYAMPAVGKLLAFWRVNFEQAERDGPRYFGRCFVSQSFESFCGDPASAMAQAYAAMDLPLPELDFGRVHPANPPYQDGSPNWERLLRKIGLSGAAAL